MARIENISMDAYVCSHFLCNRCGSHSGYRIHYRYNTVHFLSSLKLAKKLNNSCLFLAGLCIFIPFRFKSYVKDYCYTRQSQKRKVQKLILIE
jgi:hypothetical protein